MEIELVEMCFGFIAGLYIAAITARDRVSALSPRSFFTRAAGQEDE